MNELPLEEQPAGRCLTDASETEREAMMREVEKAQQDWQTRTRVRTEWRVRSHAADDPTDIEVRVKRQAARRQHFQTKRLWREKVPVGKENTIWVPNPRAWK